MANVRPEGDYAYEYSFIPCKRIETMEVSGKRKDEDDV